MSGPDAPQATVRQIDGQLVLDDPESLAVIRAVSKHNCRLTLQENYEAITRFSFRVAERRLQPGTVVIVVLNVDDTNAGLLADVLMPGHNWSEIRARGETPFARGIVERAGIQALLDESDAEAGAKLREMDGRLAVLVMDHDVAEVFETSEAKP